VFPLARIFFILQSLTQFLTQHLLVFWICSSRSRIFWRARVQMPTVFTPSTSRHWHSTHNYVCSRETTCNICTEETTVKEITEKSFDISPTEILPKIYIFLGTYLG